MNIHNEVPVAIFSHFTEQNLSVATFESQPFMAVMNGLCDGSVVLMAEPEFQFSS